jgi:hypothetical protein
MRSAKDVSVHSQHDLQHFVIILLEFIIIFETKLTSKISSFCQFLNIFSKDICFLGWIFVCFDEKEGSGHLKRNGYLQWAYNC